TNQRIPAKIYDYLQSDRPLLILADNPELAELATAAGGAAVCGLDQPQAIAAAIRAAYERGRDHAVVRAAVEGTDSASASRQLAEILDRAQARGK
ncbi:MAG: hypothetical protein KC457_18280, partial [Myxococcales bacterium]|nr:hypothetical protein [Myxococcales bacterium]